MNPGVYSPELRESCRGQLARELMLRLVIHDVRNPLTPIMGAMELLEMDGVRLPGFLTQSVDRLGAQLERYDQFTWSPPAEARALGPLIEEILGIPVEGGEAEVTLDPLRFLSALELAAPAGVHFEEGGWDWRWQVVFPGLPEKVVEAGTRPRQEELMSRFQAPEQALGACLLRVVARDALGQMKALSGPPLTLAMLLP